MRTGTYTAILISAIMILGVAALIAGGEGTRNEADFTIVTTRPVNGATNVPADSSIVIKFSAPVNDTALSISNFIIMNTGDGDIFEGEVSYDNTTYEVTISNMYHHREGSQNYSGREDQGGIHKGATIEVKIINVVSADGKPLIGSTGNPGDNYIFNFEVEPREADEDSPGFGLIAAFLVIALVVVLARKR